MNHKKLDKIKFLSLFSEENLSKQSREPTNSKKKRKQTKLTSTANNVLKWGKKIDLIDYICFHVILLVYAVSILTTFSYIVTQVILAF